MIVICLSFSTACKKDGEPLYVELNGAEIYEYTLIYEYGDVFAEYCTDAICSAVFKLTGKQLKINPDLYSETEREILIGETNREPSKKAAEQSLKSDQYILSSSGEKIIIYAEDYMVGGGASELVNGLILPSVKNGKAMVSEDGYYYAISHAPMSSNANVALGGTVAEVKIDAKIKNAVWLDSGKKIPVMGGSYTAEPFFYGISMHYRVAKLAIE